MRGHQDSVHSAEFLMFSNIVVSSSVDKTVMLWDARTVTERLSKAAVSVTSILSLGPG